MCTQLRPYLSDGPLLPRRNKETRGKRLHVSGQVPIKIASLLMVLLLLHGTGMCR